MLLQALFLIMTFERLICPVFGGDGIYLHEDVSLPNDDLYEEGDILLAGMFSLNRHKSGLVCGGDINYLAVQGAQSMIYKINQINRDQDVLSNISLGYVLLNDCSNAMTAVARATQLIPLYNHWNEEHEMDKQSKKGKSSRRSFSIEYPVVGVVGPYSSSLSTTVSPLLSFYKIPHISWLATSDELLTQATIKFPYFSRIVPADRFQAKAFVDVLSYFKWSYISLIYSAGNYGSSGVREVSKEARGKGICLAYVKAVDSDFDNTDYDMVAKNLIKYKGARVVVLFVDSSHGIRLFEAVERFEAIGNFVFFASEGFLASYVRENQRFAVNLLQFIIPGGPFRDVRWGDKGFVEHYFTLDPWNNATGSVWSGQYLPHKVGCSFEVAEDDLNWCGHYKNLSDFEGFKVINWPVRVIDVVEIFARALNKSISDNCPEAFMNKSYLKGCIDGETLNYNIRALQFVGKSVIVKFDEKGELHSSKYMLMAYSNLNGTYKYQGVGMWDNENREVELFKDISWFGLTDGRLVPLSQPPESVCSKPCLPGEFLLQGDLVCCWECHSCMEDEIVSPDGTDCFRCNVTTWPDDNVTSCIPIQPRYLRWSDDAALGLLSVTGIAFLLTLFILATFIAYRSMKIIKGSSRKLMAPILTGIMMAYAVAVTLIIKPSHVVCNINLIGFHLSCTFIFVPLFLKTLRVYSIFRAAEKLTTSVKLANINLLIGCFVVIILCQTAVSVTLLIIFPTKATLSMPVRRVKMVELACSSESVLPLMLPLGFNLLFVLMTAICGFLTRKLPDNFNESWHIFIAVVTTLIVWMAFLPTYFISFYEYFRAVLLALSLIINGLVITLCLFGPKIYAVFFIEENQIKTSNFDETEGFRSSRNPGVSVRNKTSSEDSKF